MSSSDAKYAISFATHVTTPPHRAGALADTTRGYDISTAHLFHVKLPSRYPETRAGSGVCKLPPADVDFLLCPTIAFAADTHDQYIAEYITAPARLGQQVLELDDTGKVDWTKRSRDINDLARELRTASNELADDKATVRLADMVTLPPGNVRDRSTSGAWFSALTYGEARHFTRLLQAPNGHLPHLTGLHHRGTPREAGRRLARRALSLPSRLSPLTSPRREPL